MHIISYIAFVIAVITNVIVVKRYRKLDKQITELEKLVYKNELR